MGSSKILSNHRVQIRQGKARPLDLARVKLSPLASVGLGVSGSQIAGLFIGMRYAIYTYAHREIGTQREP